MSDQEIFQRPDEVWLLNLGYISEHAEQNLMVYGYLATAGVANVELLADVEKKHVKYALVLDNASHRRYKFQKWLESKSGLLYKLVLLFFLRRFGSYDPAIRLSRCIKDYAGPAWTASTEVTSVKQYFKVSNSGGAKGWFYKDGIDEGAGVPRQDRTSSPSSSSR